MSRDDLKAIVLERSVAVDLIEAWAEWKVLSVIEDLGPNYDMHERFGGVCVCGKTHLRYLHTIENMLNGNQVYPIGSVCIGWVDKLTGTARCLAPEARRILRAHKRSVRLANDLDVAQEIVLSADRAGRRLFDGELQISNGVIEELYRLGRLTADRYNGEDPRRDRRDLRRYMKVLRGEFGILGLTRRERGRLGALVNGKVATFFRERHAEAVKVELEAAREENRRLRSGGCA